MNTPTIITFKLDMERLLRNNSRALIKEYLREELTRYETHEKTYGRKEAHHA